MYSRFLGGCAVAIAIANPAAADCTAKRFSDLSESGYFYILNSDPSAIGTSASMVGHFWQPGAYGSTGEQSCDDSHWLFGCPNCGDQSRAWYFDGTLGQMGCTSGCPAGEMLVTIEDQSTTGDRAFFVAARVDETAGDPAFDFARLGDLNLVSLPAPAIISTTSGQVFTANFFIPDPAPGFHGVAGTSAPGTITAFWVYTRNSPLPRERDSWTFVGRYPYSGGNTAGQATLVCPTSGAAPYLAAAIEFDSGAVVTTYLSHATFVDCDPFQFGAGAVRDGGPDGLFVKREASGDLTLRWGPSCLSTDDPSFEIYEGTIGDWTSHAPRDCAALTRTETISPPPFDAYYLVVPVEGTYEGSYGKRSDGTERPLGATACKQRITNTCPP